MLLNELNKCVASYSKSRSFSDKNDDKRGLSRMQDLFPKNRTLTKIIHINILQLI